MNSRTVRKINRDLKRHLHSRSPTDICEEYIGVTASGEEQTTAKKPKIAKIDKTNNGKGQSGAHEVTVKPSKAGAYLPNGKKNKMISKKYKGDTKKPKPPGIEKKKGGNLKVKIGSVVEDRVKTNDLKIIEVTLQNVPPSNLSDEAFANMGDKMSDTIDLKHKKVLHGKEAAEKRKEFQGNNTAADNNSTSLH